MEHTLLQAAEDYLGNESCGCCSCWHPATFAGDCRDDKNRFGSPEELVELWLAAPDLLEAAQNMYNFADEVQGAFKDNDMEVPHCKGKADALLAIIKARE